MSYRALSVMNYSQGDRDLVIKVSFDMAVLHVEEDDQYLFIFDDGSELIVYKTHMTTGIEEVRFEG